MTHQQMSSKGDSTILKALSTIGIKGASLSKKSTKLLKTVLTHAEMSSKGGNSRAQKLSAKRRKEIAVMGGKARAEKRLKVRTLKRDVPKYEEFGLVKGAKICIAEEHGKSYSCFLPLLPELGGSMTVPKNFFE